MIMKSKKVLSIFVGILLAVTHLSLPAKGAESLRADVINVFFDPDFPLPAGQSLLSHYQSKKYVYVYREIIPVEVGGRQRYFLLGM
jgi:hypothetical protein